MKNKLHNLSIGLMMLMPTIIFGQSAPTLGVASTFAVFTAVGQFDNIGAATYVVGDVGTDVGAFNAFPPGTVVGQIHVADPTSAQAATDVDVAYSYLSGVTCGTVIGTTLGSGQILTPDVYCLGAASTLNGNLILDGQGNPNALFIFKINGALTTGTFANVTLINSASLCNVYWQINGAFSLGDNSVFRGTIVANGAISLLEASSLFGRGLSRGGAIDMHNNIVTIGTQPTASTISASGATTFCQGGSVTLTASSNSSYLWSTGETTQSITVNTSGNYSVTITNSCGSASSSPTTVTVNPLPTVTITPGSATTFCVGNSVTLTASAGNSYLWSNNATTQSIIVSASGSYSVTVTNANGCSATSSPTIVTVNPLPTAAITPSGATTFCQGGNVTLTASTANSYLWNTGATTQNIVVTTSGNYSVTVTNANGCSATSSPTIVTVNPLPTASITPSGATTFCVGNSVTLTANAASSYLWSTGETTQSIIVSASGSYSVTVTTICGSANSSPTIVTVNPLPTAVITSGSSTTICPGDSLILSASTGNSYVWNTGATTQTITITAAGNYMVTISNGSCTASDTITINSSLILNLGNDTTVCGCIILNAYSSGATYQWCSGQQYAMITVCTTGVYCVTVSNGICIVSDTVNITVLPALVVTLGNDTSVLTNIVLNAGNNGAAYLWNTGATTQTITITASGQYYVTITNTVGCTTSDTINISVLNGVAENTVTNLPVSVYPNPSIGKILTLSFEVFQQGAVEIRIMNQLGLLVFVEKPESIRGNYSRKLDLQKLAAGTYFIEVISGASRGITKLTLN